MAFSFSRRLRSIYDAVQGCTTMLRTQHNAWIHAMATIIVVLTGLLFSLGPLEWCVVTLAIVAVWTAEGLNTAIEYLTDLASPEFHPLAGKAKDVAAGAVLISAIGATVVGLLIFGPHLLKLFKG